MERYLWGLADWTAARISNSSPGWPWCSAIAWSITVRSRAAGATSMALCMFLSPRSTRQRRISPERQVRGAGVCAEGFESEQASPARPQRSHHERFSGEMFDRNNESVDESSLYRGSQAPVIPGPGFWQWDVCVVTAETKGHSLPQSRSYLKVVDRSVRSTERKGEGRHAPRCISTATWISGLLSRWPDTIAVSPSMEPLRKKLTGWSISAGAVAPA